MTPHELFHQHTGWAYKLAATSPWSMDPKERKQAALIGLWHACLHFDPSKGHMPHFATLYIKSAIRRACLANKSQVLTCSPFYDTETDNPESLNITAEEMTRKRAKLSKALTKQRRRILDSIMSGQSQIDVAVSLGISKQRVNQVLHTLRDAVEQP